MRVETIELTTIANYLSARFNTDGCLNLSAWSE